MKWFLSYIPKYLQYALRFLLVFFNPVYNSKCQHSSSGELLMCVGSFLEWLKINKNTVIILIIVVYVTMQVADS